MRITWILIVLTLFLFLSGCSSTSSDSGKAAEPQLTLLYFDAPWCAPCQGVKSTLPEVLQSQPETFQLKQVDVDRQPDLAKTHAVDTIPALVLIDESGERGRLVGQTSVARLDDFFQQAMVQH